MASTGQANAPVLVLMQDVLSEGMSAWFYQRMLECGIKQTDIQIITVLDEAPENTGGRPSAAQLRESVSRVERDLHASSPQIVVTLGKDALHLATGLREKIDNARGYLLRPTLRGTFVRQTWEQTGEYKTGNKKTGRVKGDPKYGWIKRSCNGLLPSSFTGYVIPSYDLAYMRKMQFKVGPAFKADMLRVRRALDGKLKILQEGFQFYNTFHTLRTYDGKMFTPFDGGAEDYDTEVLAVDIETTGVDHDTIIRISLSDGTRTHTLPWDEPTRQYVERQIHLCKRWLVMHNGSAFDIPRLKAAGVEITEEMEAKNVYDTMYGAVVAQPDLRKGLGAAASVYLDVYPWKWKTIAQEDDELYSALDAFITARLFLDGLRPFTKQMRMWPLVTGEAYPWGPGVMATLPCLSDMTRQGLRVNKPVAQKWVVELEERLRGLHAQWAEMFPLIDPDSNKQMADLFYKQWKLPVVRSTEEGVTTNELAVVKSQAYIQSEYGRTRDTNPWREDRNCVPETFDLLLKIRNASKHLHTYCEPALLMDDIYVHPSYLPAALEGQKDAESDRSKGNTSSGRLATSNPNIQNQDKESRKLYIPDTDDMCFIEFDFTRAEMFAMAAMARDEVMLEDLVVDPYQRVADEVLRLTGKVILRKIAKNVTLAGQYLAGKYKVSDMIMKDEHVYVDPGTCALILDALKMRWKKRAGYMNYLVNTCKVKGYLINPFGRVRVFAMRKATEAVNFIPQSIVADCLWCVMRDVWLAARRLGGRMTTTVHDSILIQVPKNNVDLAVQTVRPLMERTFDNVAPGFSLSVGIKTGAPGVSWNEIREYAVAT